MMTSPTPGHRRHGALLSPLLLILLTTSLTATIITASSTTAASTTTPPKRFTRPVWELEYIIMIDAGSSGSRIHIHPYRDSKPVPKIQPSKSLKLTPGLSSFVAVPHDASSNIAQLLDFAKQHIPMSMWQETPVILKATAGLRTVSEADRERVLDVCRTVIKSYPFRFEPKWAKVISGRKEGIYGWLAANYLAGTLDSAQSSTVGVIEVGGASTQITFVPSAVDASLKPLLTSVNIGPQSFTVYTHSYLNYGLEAVQDLFAKRFADRVKNGNPCYNPGNPMVKPSGTGKYDECMTLMNELVKSPQAKCPAKTMDTALSTAVKCGIDGVLQPKIGATKFFAIENFYYTGAFLGVVEKKNPFQAMMDEGRRFCAMSWDEVRAKYPGERTQSVSKYCFSTVYLVALLQRGLNVKRPAQSAQIVRNVNGVGIDWALGACLYEVMRLQAPPTPSTASLATGGAGTTAPMGFEFWASCQTSRTLVGFLIVTAALLGYYVGRSNRIRGTGGGGGCMDSTGIPLMTPKSNLH